MEGTVDVRKLARKVERLEKAISGMRDLEARVSQLEDELNKGIGNITNKLNLFLQEISAQPTLSSGADSVTPDAAADSSDSTPASLLEAVEHGNTEAMAKLLEAGADPQQRDQHGDTALHLAATNGHVRALYYLLRFGAAVDARGQHLRSPLHAAACHGHLDVVTCLLEAGAQVEDKDMHGETPLTLAVEAGHEKIVKLLINNAACIDVGTERTNKSVFVAASRGHLEIITLLLQKEVSVDMCGNGGETLLVHAAKAGHWGIVKYLLGRGASATMCKTSQESALAFAAKAEEVDIVRELLRRGAERDDAQLQSALEVATTAAVVWTIVDAAPRAVHGDEGRYLLHSAALHGRREALVAFLEAGVNVNGIDDRDITALHLAAAHGRAACVNELLRRGADADVVENVQGLTPLHYASINSHVDSVRVLLAAGAYATKQNQGGMTPVDLAKTEAVMKAFREAH